MNCLKCGIKHLYFDYISNNLKTYSDKAVYESKYDSGLTILLSRTTIKDYIFQLKPQFQINGRYNEYLKKNISLECWKLNWNSQGCRQEYEWAKAHHVRVLCLEDYLDGRKVEL